MPNKEKGESEDDFVKRCIPIVLAEGTAKDGSQAAAICHSMYKQQSEKENEQSNEPKDENSEKSMLFTCEAKIQFIPESSQEGKTENSEVKYTRRMVAIVGDRFMNGGFLSWKEAKKIAKGWNGTLHNINHMGTNATALDPRPDIRFFIGYHDNVEVDENNKQISMDVHVVKDTMYAKAWEGYMKLCEQAGKIPNVSTTYYGKRKFVRASSLPQGVNYENEGYTKDDFVPYLYDIEPVCISTVLGGKCNDKAGCGIKNDDTCSCGTCKTKITSETETKTEVETTKKDKKPEDISNEKQNKIDETLEKEKQEMIKYLKSKE